jgi:hypothetical protein
MLVRKSRSALGVLPVTPKRGLHGDPSATAFIVDVTDEASVALRT